MPMPYIYEGIRLAFRDGTIGKLVPAERISWAGKSQLLINWVDRLPLVYREMVDSPLGLLFVFASVRKNSTNVEGAAVPVDAWRRLAAKAGCRDDAPTVVVPRPPMADDMIRETFRDEIIKMRRYVLNQKDNWTHVAHLHRPDLLVYAEQAQLEFERLGALLTELKGVNDYGE